MIAREVGEKLYLRALLEDRGADPTLRVFVVLKNSIGSTVYNVELISLGDGEYYEDTLTMPNTDVLFATYNVYKSDGVTLDVNYAPVQERFMKFTPVTLESTVVLGDNIEGSIADDAVLEGGIDDATITGDVNQSSVEGTIIEEIILEGVVDEYTS